MSKEKPPSRPCSRCGNMLEPFLMGTSIGSDYSTVYHWSFGHTCPKQLEAYDNRLKEIAQSGMSDEQQANARTAAGYMNAWGS